MLFALVPPVIKWGATSFVTNMGGSLAGFFLWDMIAEEEEIAGSTDINLDEQTKKLLEDVIVTNLSENVSSGSPSKFIADKNSFRS